MEKKYVVVTEEGAGFANAEVGSEVELDLEARQETALIAAGWLEEKKGGKK